MIRTTVLIAAYNAERCILRAVNSALRQSSRSLEVVVVDDCSTDGTAALVAARAAEDGRVRLVRAATNEGPGAARNLGLQAARGDWIAILDADDAFAPDRLDALLSLAERTGASIVADNIALRSADGRLDDRILFTAERLRGEEELSAERFVRGNISRRRGNYPAFGLLKPVIRRSFIAEHGISYPSIRIAEDFIFVCRCFAAGGRFYTTDRAYYLYTIDAGSLTFKTGMDEVGRQLAVETEFAASPAVLAMPALRTALAEHHRSLENAWQWARFAEALKARRIGRAASIFRSSGRAARHITGELSYVVARSLNLAARSEEDIWRRSPRPKKAR